MIVTVWNLKGLNSNLKEKELRHLIKRNKISVTGILETKIKENNARNIEKANFED